MKKLVSGRRSVLLLAGSLLLVLHQIFSFSAQTQVWFFIAGVVVLGLPHGAADVLVGVQNAITVQHRFSIVRFLSNYVFKIAVFALVYILSPAVAILLFVVAAAFHFGETDLQQFDTRSRSGKWFAFTYGMLLLALILLPHVEEVVPVLQRFGIAEKHLMALGQMGERSGTLVLSLLALFFVSVFIYCRQHRHQKLPDEGFLLFLTGLCILLYSLPLLLGFTFYFVVWHSVLSLSDIVGYLREKGQRPYRIIIYHIVLYSSLAFLGLALIGGGGSLLLEERIPQSGFLLALAFLTLPHMNVMHDMYNALRKFS